MGDDDPAAKQSYRLEVEMTLRSTQGLLYYLGEHMRHQIFEGGTPRVASALERGKTADQRLGSGRLFAVERMAAGQPAEGALLAVRYRDSVYAVPDYPRSGRSLQLLDLARQLFSLNLEAKDFPTTQVVRFLN